MWVVVGGRVKRLRWVALSLAVLALGGCGDSDDDGGGGGDSGDQAGGVEQQQSCRPASKALVAAIEQGLTVTGGGKLRRAYIVRSNDFEKVYMVAADIQGDGLEGDDDIGVWATNSPKAEGLIYAVDSVAQEFSDWGDADKTDAAIDASAHGVDEGRACVEG
jgi:hypothetical protein